MRQRCALTFRGPRCLLPLLENLQAHGNVQKLLIAISVPHEELLVLVDLLAALVEDLPLTLYCDQVLLRRETGTVDIRHPVPCTSFSINKVAQLTIFKDLNGIKQTLEMYLLFFFWFDIENKFTYQKRTIKISHLISLNIFIINIIKPKWIYQLKDICLGGVTFLKGFYFYHLLIPKFLG